MNAADFDQMGNDGKQIRTGTEFVHIVDGKLAGEMPDSIIQRQEIFQGETGLIDQTRGVPGIEGQGIIDVVDIHIQISIPRQFRRGLTHPESGHDNGDEGDQERGKACHGANGREVV